MSKRGQEMQGGDERYGGGPGSETPVDTPAKATAAQMARRKIASMKGGRAQSRSVSPVKTGPPSTGFTQGFQPATNNSQSSFTPPQSSFSFGSSQSTLSNGFNFGQSQSQTNGASTNGFSFGQSQPSASTSFTFGQTNPSQQASTPSFGNSTASFSFPPTTGASNPFSAQSSTQSSQGAGFQGSIFTFGAPAKAAETSKTEVPNGVNGFGGPKGLSEEDKQYLLDRERTLTLSQAKEFEKIIDTHLNDSAGTELKHVSLDGLPSDKQQDLLRYLRSLPAADPSTPRAFTSLFGVNGRPRTQRPIVTDSQRAEIFAAAQKMSPEQQNELIQIVKRAIPETKDKPNNEMPGFQNLPNDVQYSLWEHVQKKPTDKPAAATAQQQPQSTTDKGAESPTSTPAPSKPLFQFAAPTAPSTPAAPASTSQETPATKANPFASILKPPPSAPPKLSSAPATTSTDAPKSLFSTPAPAKEASSKPFSGFSFNAPADKTPNGTLEPFAPKSLFASPSKTSEDQTSTQKAATPFNATGSGSTPAATPANSDPTPKVSFSFSQPAANPFSGAGLAEPKDETSSRKPVEAPKSLFAPSTQPPAPRTPTESPVPTSREQSTSTNGRANGQKLRRLNKSLLRYLQHSDLDHDWTSVLQYYKDQADSMLKSSPPSPQKPARPAPKAQAPPSPEKPAQPPTQPASETAFKPTTPSTTMRNTQSLSQTVPSKPLSQTASLFDNILARPQQPQKQDESPSGFTPAKPAPSSTSTSSGPAFALPKFGTGVAPAANDTPKSAPVFSFGKPAGDNKPGESKAPTFSLPKFGSGGSTDFMSAFGAQAQKQADKDKAKRKADEFDSDEDNEEEWERQDREKQEAKRQKLQAESRKQLKNVNGKFVLVDVNEDGTGAGANGSSDAAPKSSGSIFGAPAKSQSTDSGSVFDKAPPKSTGGFNPFAHLGNKASPQEDEEDEEDEGDEDEGTPKTPATQSKTRSLFDRVDQPSKDNQAPKPFSFGESIFNKSTGPGDHTWKPETPIKFSSTGTDGSTTPDGSPAKPLFSFGKPSAAGPTTSDKSESSAPKFSFSNATPPASTTPAPFKFNFGSTSDKPATSNLFSSTPGQSLFSGISTNVSSANASRATTPGVTTDAGDSVVGDSADDDASHDPQKDLTSLTAEEEETEHVLFDQKARLRQFIRGEKDPWQNKGIGILRLFKNKTTGKLRMLMRQDPSGSILLNNNVMLQKDMYASMTDKGVKMVFPEQDGSLSTFMAGFGTKDKAADLLKTLHGEIEKAG